MPISKLPKNIIQITGTGVKETQFTQCECILFALTSTGRIYFATNRDGFDDWTLTERNIKNTEVQ